MPQFSFEQVDPDNDNRLRVSLKDTGEARGITYLTKGAGWVAEHAGLAGKQGGVQGFKTEYLAAEFMYWFKAPEQSWCGVPWPHDWPGKDGGAPHPRDAQGDDR
ncbi:hypothetical protein JK364_23655 [Streptomyces sp. 110]|uniref:Uncharacterized protein n=1 Tax=Streptomyces endocoffeicus TaxID=2898945 RepID=A0ABS1PSF5_9ACTN|nr:hypothetical protein [Streptomyces endocoffeicus]MBL1115370.1 hypothetical protein [Streptomyces endocoffeicus]